MSLTETTDNKDTENNTIASSLVQSCLNQCFATAIPHSSAGRRKYSFTFLSAEVLRGIDSWQNCLVYLPEYTAVISLSQRVCHAVLTQEKWACVTHRLTLRFSAIFKPGQVPQIRNARILSVNEFVLDEWMDGKTLGYTDSEDRGDILGHCLAFHYRRCAINQMRQWRSLMACDITVTLVPCTSLKDIHKMT